MIDIAQENAPAIVEDRGGAMNALVNFWITRIAYEDDAKPRRTAPESNLEDSAASALYNYLRGAPLETYRAINLGIELAAIVARNPFDAAGQIRAAIARTVAEEKAVNVL